MKLLQDTKKSMNCCSSPFFLRQPGNGGGRGVGLEDDTWLNTILRSSSCLVSSTFLFFFVSLLCKEEVLLDKEITKVSKILSGVPFLALEVEVKFKISTFGVWFSDGQIKSTSDCHNLAMILPRSHRLTGLFSVAQKESPWSNRRNHWLATPIATLDLLWMQLKSWKWHHSSACTCVDDYPLMIKRMEW